MKKKQVRFIGIQKQGRGSGIPIPTPHRTGQGGMMKTIISVLVLTALTGCTTTQDPTLRKIHADAWKRIEYKKYYKMDFRYVPLGTKSEGNCAVYAQTYRIDAMKAGYTPYVHLCYMPDGTPHAYTQVGDWALDNRFSWPIPMEQQDCESLGLYDPKNEDME